MTLAVPEGVETSDGRTHSGTSNRNLSEVPGNGFKYLQGLTPFLSMSGGAGITQPAALGPVRRYLTVPNLLMLIGGVIAVGSVAATFGTTSQWIGHAVMAIFGLLVLVIVILTGAIQAGRISRKSAFRVYPLHRAASIWFSLVVVVTFILGLLAMMGHGEPLLQSIHGIVGLTLTVLALIQLVPSLIVAKRSSIRTIHRIVGYLIAVLFSAQVYLGLNSAGFFV